VIEQNNQKNKSSELKIKKGLNKKILKAKVTKKINEVSFLTKKRTQRTQQQNIKHQ
jgi:hypothetical protein